MAERKLTYDNLIPCLLEEIPEFQSVYDEHMDANFDELLPCVLLADFVRFLFDAYRRSESKEVDAPGWDRVLHKGLHLMEEAISSNDQKLWNLIAACFVECLPPSSEEDLQAYQAIKSRLGASSNLSKQLSFYDPNTLLVDDAKYSVPYEQELRRQLDIVRQRVFSDTAFAEIWMLRSSGEALVTLVSRRRAWLMYLPEPGDPGQSTRNPVYAGPPGAMIDFVLTNGQLDQYPASWTISTEEALQAIEYFWRYGTRPDWLTWHDDAQADG